MKLAGRLIGLLAVGACTPQAETLVVRNAKIWTGDPDMSSATMMVIRDGRFSYVGIDEPAFCGFEKARLLDARGARIIPGLIDSHLHLISGGLQLSRLQLRDVTGRQAFIAAVADHARQLPEGSWILGGRWSTESWPDPAQPTKEWIDPVTPDHPLLLSRMDGHGALANSVALRLSGIDKNGPADPPGGQIERDPETGEPTGILKDTAIGLVGRHVPPPTADELDAALDAAMKEANRHGLTCVHTMSPWSDLAVLDRARSAGRLTLRTRVYVMEDDWRDYVDQAKSRANDEWVQICGFKQFADGSLGSRTAYMSAPYADKPPNAPDCCGLPRKLLDPSPEGERRARASSAVPAEVRSRSQLTQLYMAAHEAGLSPAIHAIGDRAIHEVLDTYEVVIGSPPDRTHSASGRKPGANQIVIRNASFRIRPRIEHAQHLLPADIPRFARIGVVASMQPYHKADDGRYAEKAIGPERCKTSYAFRSLIDSGAHVAFGSDWPVVSLNPFLGIHAALTGRTLDGKVFVPEQNITLEEALRCYTSGAAYAAGEEDRLGMIKAGFLADFVILKFDLLDERRDAPPPDSVRRVFVHGKCVYQTPGELWQ